MPRIRSLKPELAADRKFASVSRDARYTFILLITRADDDGLVRAEPRQLLGELYPHDGDVDEATLMGWLDELLEIGVVRARETTDGAKVAEIVNWDKHQKIENRAKAFLSTLLVKSSRESREGLPRVSRGSPETLPERSLESRVLTNSAKGAENWVRVLASLWRAQYDGEPSFGVIGKHCKPLFEAHGLDKLRAHWITYLKATPGQYASPARFAQTFGEWAPKKSKSQADAMLRPDQLRDAS